jgi:hypothetical protein
VQEWLKIEGMVRLVHDMRREQAADGSMPFCVKAVKQPKSRMPGEHVAKHAADVRSKETILCGLYTYVFQTVYRRFAGVVNGIACYLYS